MQKERIDLIIYALAWQSLIQLPVFIPQQQMQTTLCVPCIAILAYSHPTPCDALTTEETKV